MQKTRAVRIALGFMVGGLGAFIAAMASRGGAPWAVAGGVMMAVALALMAWPGKKEA